jgi:ATP-dependent Clp protease adaptor protein ClpS
MDVLDRSNFPQKWPKTPLIAERSIELIFGRRGSGVVGGKPKACARCAPSDLAVRQIAVYDVSAKDLDLMPMPLARAPKPGPTSPLDTIRGGAKWSISGQAAPARLAGDDDRKRNNGGGDRGNPSTAVITKTKPLTKRPNVYRVLLLNDDYTPMEFVVHVLERFFNKDREAATRIMLHVHHHGIGECGVYTYEVAETKVTQVMDFARKHQHPLQCVMEKK